MFYTTYLLYQSVDDGQCKRLDVLVIRAEAHPRLTESDRVPASGHAIEL